jgi:hypothetical protein
LWYIKTKGDEMNTLTVKKWFKSGIERYYFSDENGNQIGFIQEKELQNGGGITTLHGDITWDLLSKIIPNCVRVGSEMFQDSVDFFRLNEIVKSKILIKVQL